MTAIAALALLVATSPVPRLAVVLAAVDGAPSDADRLDLEDALAAGLSSGGHYAVAKQSFVDQVVVSSRASGVLCSFSDDVACWLKIGLAGDFDALAVV